MPSFYCGAAIAIKSFVLFTFVSTRALSAARVFVTGINSPGVTLRRSRVQSAYYASRSGIGISFEREKCKKKKKRAMETRRLKSSVGQSRVPSIFFSFFFFLNFPPRNVRALSETRRAVCLNCRGA